MVEVEDTVRASRAENQRTLAKSYQIWSSYSKEADIQKRLQPYYVQLRNVLGRVPAYLASGFSQHSGSSRLKLEHTGLNSGNSQLLISGRSRWRTAKGDCDLEDKIIPAQLLLGVQRSTPCYFANDSRFANWPGLEGESGGDVGGNYLAVVAFAYAYILSARWVEMQQSNDTTHISTRKHDGIFYLGPRAKWMCGYNEQSLDELVVDLGDVDENAARWWAAILATGEGWRTEIVRDGIVYQSPWSICIAATQRFRLRRTAGCQKMGEPILIPPSSEAAMRYLSDFSMLHGIESQCSVALAATLTFPFLGDRVVTLPLPNPTSTTAMLGSPQTPIAAFHRKKGAISEHSKLLPYYMTLSCNRRGMQALLCGSFFDPQVSCNLVSAWFQPILETVDPLIKASNYEKLAIIMGKRQPKLATLWMGAIVSGMANVIFQQVRIGLMAIELHASAWTATTHSFISLNPEGLCGNKGTEISRSDECRLLYLTDAEGHSRLPISPWKPFGTTMLCDTDISVRQHAKCAGHCLQYINWSWDLYDGTALEDQGFNLNECNEDTSAATVEVVVLDLQKDRFLKSEMLSELATRSIFNWLRNSGWPQREKEFYCHSWIEIEGSDEELSDLDSDDGNSQRANTRRAVEEWLEEQHTTESVSEASVNTDRSTFK